ncbi:MAG: serine hydrolase domain-containing protein [Gammaproteobacteria bacterium]
MLKKTMVAILNNHLTRSLICSVAFFTPISLFAQSIDAVADEFEIYMSKTLTDWKIPGAAVVIVKDDRIVLMRGFGVRQVGKPEKVDTQTVFRLASLSKGFASTLTGLLVAGGDLSWNDQVVDYLPDFKLQNAQQTQQTTITHVLSHTIGLPEHTHTNLIENNTPYPDIVDRLDKVNLSCKVGKCHAYQNVAYSLSGDIIEKVSGKSYSEMMHERIFVPLGMYNASTSYEALMASPNRASCHVRGKNGYSACTITSYYYNVVPAGGINASISDMGQWLKAQMGGYPDDVPPVVLDAIHTPLINNTAEIKYGYDRSGWRKERIKNSYYGLGWRIYDYQGHEMVFHGGMLKGFQNAMGFIPEEKVGIVVLTNSNSAVAGFLTAKFFDLYLDLPDRDWNSRALGKG